MALPCSLLRKSPFCLISRRKISLLWQCHVRGAQWLGHSSIPAADEPGTYMALAVCWVC